MVDDVDVVIVGGGIAGVLAGVNLRKAGVERIRIIDQAGGIGGTWYWNRYPGVMCDVESYIYLPMLEELDYVPKHRYASGEEIRLHLQAIADRFDLGVRRPVPHRGDPHGVGRGRRPLAGPHRPGRRADLPLLRARGRDPQPPEAAGHRGHGGLRRAIRSTPHGGTTATPVAVPGEPLTELGDKVVGLVGTGATGIQCLPPLAAAAKHVYVFQRTPSAIGVRGNRATDPDFAASRASPVGSRPGWTTSSRSCWAGPSRSTSPTTGGPITTARSNTDPGGRA